VVTDTRRRRPEQESLFFASQALERVIAEESSTEAWFASAHGALRDCTLAVETQLHALNSPGGIGGDVKRNEPRLLPALGRLEAALARLLVDFWEAEAIPATARPLFVPRLQALADELRDLANQEWNFVYDVQNEPGGID
jgi:hypothetical protein